MFISTLSLVFFSQNILDKQANSFNLILKNWYKKLIDEFLNCARNFEIIIKFLVGSTKSDCG